MTSYILIAFDDLKWMLPYVEVKDCGVNGFLPFLFLGLGGLYDDFAYVILLSA